jgi:hypothetical protein
MQNEQKFRTHKPELQHVFEALRYGHLCHSILLITGYGAGKIQVSSSGKSRGSD